jgi:hypothetical protein
MSMTAQFDENRAQRGSHKHAWGNPLPGAGRMKVCRVCGEKQTPITSAAECGGRPADGLVDTLHDYDPTT